MFEKKGCVVCRCEEIYESEIRSAVKAGCHDLDSVKRCTRAGMGRCQSKICSSVVTRIIREETGLDPNEIKPFTVRAPLRPISAKVLGDPSVVGYEPEEMEEL